MTPNTSQCRPEKLPTRTELYFETKLAEKLHAFKVRVDKFCDLSLFYEVLIKIKFGSIGQTQIKIDIT